MSFLSLQNRPFSLNDVASRAEGGTMARAQVQKALDALVAKGKVREKVGRGGGERDGNMGFIDRIVRDGLCVFYAVRSCVISV